MKKNKIYIYKKGLAIGMINIMFIYFPIDKKLISISTSPKEIANSHYLFDHLIKWLGKEQELHYGNRIITHRPYKLHKINERI